MTRKYKVIVTLHKWHCGECVIETELKILIKMLHCIAPRILLANKTSLHPKQCIIIFITDTIGNHQNNCDFLYSRFFIYVISFNYQNILQYSYLLASTSKDEEN